MKIYQIKVNGLTYQGLFASTCDAVVDAMDRFPAANRISARAAL